MQRRAMSAQEQPQPAPDAQTDDLELVVREWWACLKESTPEETHAALREKLEALLKTETITGE